MKDNKEAKLKYKPNSFEILSDGEYVFCAVSKKKIYLSELSYWSVDLQEAYYSVIEADIRYKQILNKN